MKKEEIPTKEQMKERISQYLKNKEIPNDAKIIMRDTILNTQILNGLPKSLQGSLPYEQLFMLQEDNAAFTFERIFPNIEDDTSEDYYGILDDWNSALQEYDLTQK